MVSALRVAEKTENGLSYFIKKLAGENKKQYQLKHQARIKKSFVDESVQKLAINSIIEGYFPKEKLVKDMAIKRVNKTLCVILSLLIGIVVISYYFVISCEIKLNDLSKETVILNNENEDLQNQLDSLKSFNNVDKTLQQNNMFQKSGQVIETNEITVNKVSTNHNQRNKKIFVNAIGF